MSTRDFIYSSWNPAMEIDELSERNDKPLFIVTEKNGFLPRITPLEKLPEEFSTLKSLLTRMPLILHNGQPGLLADGKLGETVLKELQVVAVDHITDSALLMALFRDYTFLASAYLLEPCDIVRRSRNEFGKGRDRLPASIAVPLEKIAKKIGSRPFMEYAQSYALYNYKLIDKSLPVRLDNMELIRKFSGLKSETGFIVVHVDMVSHTGDLVKYVKNALDSVDLDEREEFDKAISHLVKIMNQINRSMEKMWKESSPSDYMKFRTFIMGTKNQDTMFPNGVIYEGVSDEPRFYRGESGANDSIVPTIDNFLQLTEKMPKNEMTDILREFRTYRPEDHTRWLEWVEESAKGLRVDKYAKKSNTSLRLYILLLDQVREFRARHWNFAKDYIIKRTAYPKATGGSPMATWLPNQLMVVLNELEHHCKYLGNNNFSDEVEKISDRATLQKNRLQAEVALLTGTPDRRETVKIW